jgi:hypothetical protein
MGVMKSEGKATAAAGAAVLLAAATACGGTARAVERHLVYLRGPSLAAASVWIADVNGAHPRRLTRGSTAVLSPDGRTVAVSRRGGGIYLVSSDGKRERRLTAQRLRPRAWSPDGETLVATASSSQTVVELAAVERGSGRLRVIARGSLYGFDFSPSGDELVYSRAPSATYSGICGDQFDLYVAKLDGGTPSRLTHDGVSAFPVWGSSGIAFSRFPGGASLEDCAAPGIWTLDADGSDLHPIIARAPEPISISGRYGLQPLAWLDDDRLLVGVRGESGNEGAVLDTRNNKLRRLGEYAEEASSDGRFFVGSGGEEGVAVSIMRIRDRHRVFVRQDSCCPDWNR